MKCTFKLELNVGNGVVDDCWDVAVVLKQISEKLFNSSQNDLSRFAYSDTNAYPILDCDGNTVGFWKVVV